MKAHRNNRVKLTELARVLSQERVPVAWCCVLQARTIRGMNNGLLHEG